MSQDAGGPSGPKEEQTIAVGVVSANEEKWWIDPASPPEATRFAQSCESLFESGEGVLALQRVLETLSVHGNDWQLSLAGASLVMRYTTRYDIVDVLLRNVLRLQPDNVQAQSSSAHLSIARGDIAGGCARFAEMIARYPGKKIEIGEYITMSLLEVGYPSEALEILKYLLGAGNVSASLLNNLGCALERLNRSTEALPWYEKALQLSPERPEIVFGYACTLIKAGQFEKGWPVYFERALQLSKIQNWLRGMPRLRPDTELSGKRVLLFQEQGLGDTLQFIRHVPVLLARGADISLHVPKSLVRLMRMSFPAITVLEPDPISEGDLYDYVAPIPDLPYLTNVHSIGDVPAKVPYLVAKTEDTARFEASLPQKKPRIGLVWAGERRSRSEFALADMRRSVSFEDMTKALLPVEASLVNLQFGVERKSLAEWQGQEICDPMGAVQDMADTAALMQGLDLIISVDTSPVHLAGALGRPVWLISRWDACWRWGDEGQGSPWYPTMRVFRSGERSFASVLQEVGKALRLWVDMWQPQ
ncbi:tetratricopeptide repeat protein [Asaia astilbis]